LAANCRWRYSLKIVGDIEIPVSGDLPQIYEKCFRLNRAVAGAISAMGHLRGGTETEVN
jgi:hypothetical protein